MIVFQAGLCTLAKNYECVYKVIQKIYILLFIFTAGAYITVNAQCLQSDPDFPSGEYIKYEVAYNWGLLWVNAGEVFFKTDTLLLENEKYYHFESYGQTYPLYDWFYKVRDRYNSTVRARGFIPRHFQRTSSEGGYEVNNSYSYSRDGTQVSMSLWNTKQGQKTDTLDLPPCSLDVLSAIYYTRSLDFEKFKTDSMQSVNFIIDGKVYALEIKYHGNEVIKTRGNHRYSCIRFSTQLVAGTIFKEGEKLNVWVSDDDNKIPVLVEAHVIVGSVKAYIKEFKQLKSPLIR